MTMHGSYRDEISDDLNLLAEKWRSKGMPGLAAILAIVDWFYTKEMEGHLLAVLTSLTNLTVRLTGVVAHAPNAQRPAGAGPADSSRTERRPTVLADAPRRQQRAHPLRAAKRRP